MSAMLVWSEKYRQNRLGQREEILKNMQKI